MYISEPYSWSHEHISEELKEDAIEAVAQEVSTRLFHFASTRLWDEQMNMWSTAYNPNESPSRITTDLINDLSSIIRDSVESVGGRVTYV